jgi:putative hydrolase of the HAD superfamily
MKFSPKAIFFDWDHTLWDHDRNAFEVIQELMVELPIERALSHSDSEIWAAFQLINDRLWDNYQHGRISQKELRETRFVQFFEAMSWEGDAQIFSDLYLSRTPRKTNLLPGAYQVIESLAYKYPLYVLTNGFDDIQHVKIQGVGMSHFFQRIITSELAGCKKPSPDFFHFALKEAQCLASEVVMVGDHPIIDIQAAEAVGISAIHLHVRDEAESANLRITQLIQLLDLFE